jgi:hypothetical protein
MLEPSLNLHQSKVLQEQEEELKGVYRQGRLLVYWLLQRSQYCVYHSTEFEMLWVGRMN